MASYREWEYYENINYRFHHDDFVLNGNSSEFEYKLTDENGIVVAKKNWLLNKRMMAAVATVAKRDVIATWLGKYADEARNTSKTKDIDIQALFHLEQSGVFIEGDSLIMLFLRYTMGGNSCNTLIDSKFGCTSIELCYHIDKFLKAFFDHGFNLVSVIFFDNHESLFDNDEYLFLRRVVMESLLSSSESTRILVECFDSFLGDPFMKYVEKRKKFLCPIEMIFMDVTIPVCRLYASTLIEQNITVGVLSKINLGTVEITSKAMVIQAKRAKTRIFEEIEELNRLICDLFSFVEAPPPSPVTPSTTFVSGGADLTLYDSRELGSISVNGLSNLRQTLHEDFRVVFDTHLEILRTQAKLSLKERLRLYSTFSPPHEDSLLLQKYTELKDYHQVYCRLLYDALRSSTARRGGRASEVAPSTQRSPSESTSAAATGMLAVDLAGLPATASVTKSHHGGGCTPTADSSLFIGDLWDGRLLCWWLLKADAAAADRGRERDDEVVGSASLGGTNIVGGTDIVAGLPYRIEVQTSFTRRQNVHIVPNKQPLGQLHLHTCCRKSSPLPFSTKLPQSLAYFLPVFSFIILKILFIHFRFLFYLFFL